MKELKPILLLSLTLAYFSHRISGKLVLQLKNMLACTSQSCIILALYWSIEISSNDLVDEFESSSRLQQKIAATVEQT